MNLAPEPLFEIQEIPYGVHRCDGARFFQYRSDGAAVDFCLERVPIFGVNQGPVKFRAFLPSEFHQLATSDAQRHWRACAVTNMINFFSASAFSSDAAPDLAVLKSFIAE